ncbi:hypothetical protein PC9H_002732 [Pleurotus ostreatus]|uniref:Uncharacterized protein n=1 Tax=Pleurotus ostreatus TaxID=5322 RepID=A0A8H6ZKF8_PLEOS|nr:uncharacterized protein PC9H_002732 [Pleurotus ostreatus]KAF7416466.1 hypothetical protein PC9H_002732 [Pleurotus ostreatus]
MCRIEGGATHSQAGPGPCHLTVSLRSDWACANVDAGKWDFELVSSLSHFPIPQFPVLQSESAVHPHRHRSSLSSQSHPVPRTPYLILVYKPCIPARAVVHNCTTLRRAGRVRVVLPCMGEGPEVRSQKVRFREALHVPASWGEEQRRGARVDRLAGLWCGGVAQRWQGRCVCAILRPSKGGTGGTAWGPPRTPNKGARGWVAFLVGGFWQRMDRAPAAEDSAVAVGAG